MGQIGNVLNISQGANSTSSTAKLMAQYNLLDASQQKVIMSSSLLSATQKSQIAAVQALSTSNMTLTQSRIQSTIAHNQELATNQSSIMSKLGLTAATDTLTLSQLKELAITNANAKILYEAIIAQETANIVKGKSIISTEAQVAANGRLAFSSGVVTKGLLAQAAAWAMSPMGMVTIAVGAIVGAIALFNAVNVTIEEQTEKVKEATAAYKTAQSELENINSELETTAKKIDELNAKSSLTFAEESELQNLKDITAELLIQQDIKQRESNEAAKEAGEASAKLYKKRYGDKQFSQEGVQKNDSTESNAYLAFDPANIERMIAAYFRFVKLQQQSVTEHERLKAAGEDTIWIEQDKQRYTKELNSIKAETLKNVDHLQAFISSINLVPEELRVDIFGDDWEAQLQNAKNGIELIYDNLDKITGQKIKFAEIINKDEFSDIYKELTALGEQGKLTAEILNGNKYNKFIAQLKAAGFSIEDVIAQLNTMSETVKDVPIEQKFDSLKDISTHISNIESLGAALKEFSDEGIITSDSLLKLQTELNATDEQLASLQQAFQLGNQSDVQAQSSAPPQSASSAQSDSLQQEIAYLSKVLNSTTDYNQKQQLQNRITQLKYQQKSRTGYKNGTKNALAGIANVDEVGEELIIRNPSQGRYTALEAGDGVLPANLTERIFSLANNPLDYMIKGIGKLSSPDFSNISNSISNPISINQGDINVHGNMDKAILH